jgi:hypothetical protein
MGNLENKKELEPELFLIREQMEIIRINMDILRVLVMQGRIKVTDDQLAEINNLDNRVHKSFQDFVLSGLPAWIQSDPQPSRDDMARFYLEWLDGLHGYLRKLDRLTKDYISSIREDHKQVKPVIKPVAGPSRKAEVRDKRFWEFLDREDTGSPLFESFEKPRITEESNQTGNPEKSKGEDQG